MSGLSSSAEKVQAALEAKGFSFEVQELDQSTRTAAEAASAIGCEVAQIAKSILFRAEVSGRPVLVIASGVNRVNEKAIAKLLGEKPGKADADFVRAETGFVIGGVRRPDMTNPLLPSSTRICWPMTKSGPPPAPPSPSSASTRGRWPN